jgi:hypothetical protein
MPLCGAGRSTELAKIPRVLAVVENDLLIQIVEVVEHGVNRPARSHLRKVRFLCPREK